MKIYCTETDTPFRQMCIQSVALQHLLVSNPMDLLRDLAKIDDPEQLAALDDAGNGSLANYIWMNTYMNVDGEDALGKLTRAQFNCVTSSRGTDDNRRRRGDLLLTLLSRTGLQPEGRHVYNLARLLVDGHYGTYQELVELATVLTRLPVPEGQAS